LAKELSWDQNRVEFAMATLALCFLLLLATIEKLRNKMARKEFELKMKLAAKTLLRPKAGFQVAISEAIISELSIHFAAAIDHSFHNLVSIMKTSSFNRNPYRLISSSTTLLLSRSYK